MKQEVGLHMYIDKAGHAVSVIIVDDLNRIHVAASVVLVQLSNETIFISVPLSGSPAFISMDRMNVGTFVEIRQQPVAVEPHPRSRHCCSTDGVNLFVYGGYHSEYCEEETEEEDDDDDEEVITEIKVFTEMWCFNLFTETWHKVSMNGNMPVTAAHMSMMYYSSSHTPNPELLLYGGTAPPFGKHSNADVIAFVLEDKTWKPLTCTGKRPLGKYGAAMTLKGDCLYVFGGCRQNLKETFLFNSELHCLNLKSKSWSLLHDNPEARCRTMYMQGLAWHKNKLYIIGSNYRDVASRTHLERINVFNLDTQTWEWKCTRPCLSDRFGFPRQRKFHSCVQWENEVYICGGHNNRVVFADLWKLELPSLQWSKIPAEMPSTRYFHSAAITSTKCMYIFGGITDLEDEANDNEVFRIWLAIPPLQDMALKKVLSLLPDTSAENITKLQDMGVPNLFLQKLKHIE